MSFNHLKDNHGWNILEKSLEYRENEPDQESSKKLRIRSHSLKTFSAQNFMVCDAAGNLRWPNVIQSFTYKAMQGTTKWNSRTKKQLHKEHFHGYQETLYCKDIWSCHSDAGGW